MNLGTKQLKRFLACTLAATEAITAAGRAPSHFLDRHLAGDWGEGLTFAEQQSNELAVAQGLAVASAYLLENGETLWVLTEIGGQVTRMLLGDEL